MDTLNTFWTRGYFIAWHHGCGVYSAIGVSERGIRLFETETQPVMDQWLRKENSPNSNSDEQLATDF